MRIITLMLTLLILCSSIALAKPEIVLNIPEYTLRLMEGNSILKKYDVAIGTAEDQTPVGNFAVIFKEINPTWYPGSKVADRTPVPPGPENPLGRRWIEFAPAYGMHGTHKLWTVEYPISRGCVRMYNPDVEELFELVDVGTPVTVIYETITLSERDDGLYVKIFSDIYEWNTTSREKYLELTAPFMNRYVLTREPVWPVEVDFGEVYESKIGVRVNAQ